MEKTDKPGFELFSWQVFDEWHYVLLPGTDGHHHWAELAAATPYHERDELKKALAKLPKGEHVTWLKRCDGAPPGRLNRPLIVFQKQLVDFSQEHGITLTISD